MLGKTVKNNVQTIKLKGIGAHQKLSRYRYGDREIRTYTCNRERSNDDSMMGRNNFRSGFSKFEGREMSLKQRQCL
jgi:hypothetical protein